MAEHLSQRRIAGSGRRLSEEAFVVRSPRETSGQLCTVRSVVQARSDVVGSLLRPQRLLEARERFAGGELSIAAFKAVEDDAVDGALRLQEEAGVEVVTDGEMRRLSFQSQLPAAVEGFSHWDLDAFLWGDWHGDEVGDLRVERPELAVVGQLG